MEKSSILFVGLDVYKDTIDIGVAESGREVQYQQMGTAAHGVGASDMS